MIGKRNDINMAKKKKKNKRKKKRIITIKTKDTPTVKSGKERKSDLREKGIFLRDHARKKDSQKRLKPIQKDSNPNENIIHRTIKTSFESNRKRY